MTLVLARDQQQRALETDTPEQAAVFGRLYNQTARSLRQTLALKARLDRECRISNRERRAEIRRKNQPPTDPPREGGDPGFFPGSIGAGRLDIKPIAAPTAETHKTPGSPPSRGGSGFRGPASHMPRWTEYERLDCADELNGEGSGLSLFNADPNPPETWPPWDPAWQRTLSPPSPAPPPWPPPTERPSRQGPTVPGCGPAWPVPPR